MELRQLAEDRILDAQVLLAGQRWSGAYYVAGYAVECGLKACIARLTAEHDFPPKVKFVQDCYTHELLKASGRKCHTSPTRKRGFSEDLACASGWYEFFCRSPKLVQAANLKT